MIKVTKISLIKLYLPQEFSRSTPSPSVDFNAIIVLLLLLAQTSDQWTERSLAPEDRDTVTFAELGLAEDHFSHPEVCGGLGGGGRGECVCLGVNTECVNLWLVHQCTFN